MKIFHSSSSIPLKWFKRKKRERERGRGEERRERKMKKANYFIGMKLF